MIAEIPLILHSAKSLSLSLEPLRVLLVVAVVQEYLIVALLLSIQLFDQVKSILVFSNIFRFNIKQH